MAKTYKIGEAAALLNLKTYVLRFWETEFPHVAPLRTSKGQRLYTEEHLGVLERVRFLLHECGHTIEGARKKLAEEQKRGSTYTFGSKGRVEPNRQSVPDGSYSEDTGTGYAEDDDAPVSDTGSVQHSLFADKRYPVFTQDKVHFYAETENGIALQPLELAADASISDEIPPVPVQGVVPQQFSSVETHKLEEALAAHKEQSRTILLEIAAKLESVAYLLRTTRPKGHS